MFNLLKSRCDNNIYSPVNGKCIDISEVEDIGFASKAMGDGVAFIPINDVVVSPCDGTLKMVFRTGHAFGIKADNGLEILIHIGIDTVNLEGKGFTVLKGINEKIKKGDPIVIFDLEEVQKSYDTSILMIVTNGKMFEKIAIGKNVCTGEAVLERGE